MYMYLGVDHMEGALQYTGKNQTQQTRDSFMHARFTCLEHPVSMTRYEKRCIIKHDKGGGGKIAQN